MDISGHRKSVIERRVVFAAGTAAVALADAEVAAGRADQRMSVTNATFADYAYTPPAGYVWSQFAAILRTPFNDGGTNLTPQATIEYDGTYLGSLISESWQDDISASPMYGPTVRLPIADGATPITFGLSLAGGGVALTGLAYMVVSLYQR